VQPAVEPSAFQPQVPLFEHVGEHVALLAVAQLVPDQAAVHLHTPAAPSAVQAHMPPFAHIGLQAAGLAVVHAAPDQAAEQVQSAVPAEDTAQAPRPEQEVTVFTNAHTHKQELGWGK
jgi:hypothetical protein